MIANQTQLASIHSSALVPLALVAAGQSSRKGSTAVKPRRRVATVFLTGILTPEYLAFVRRELISALGNDAIEQVLIRANSPGGFVQGTPETAEIVRRLSKAKPTTVIAEGHLCSAAYWAVSGATHIIASPSATVGSCGVIVVLADDSEAFAAEGVRVIPVKTAPAKQRGLPGVPITEADIAAVSRSINETRIMFTRDLRLAGRMTAQEREDAFLSGEAYHAAEAKKRGFIDEVSLVEDAEGEIFDSQPERFENVFGVEAYQKYYALVCAESKCEYLADASEVALKKIARDFPELTEAAESHVA